MYYVMFYIFFSIFEQKSSKFLKKVENKGI